MILKGWDYQDAVSFVESRNVKIELPQRVQQDEADNHPRTKVGAKIKPRRKPYCNRMHRMTPDNIYYLPHSGQPMCRQCIVIRRALYKEKIENEMSRLRVDSTSSNRLKDPGIGG